MLSKFKQITISPQFESNTEKDIERKRAIQKGREKLKKKYRGASRKCTHTLTHK